MTVDKSCLQESGSIRIVFLHGPYIPTIAIDQHFPTWIEWLHLSTYVVSSTLCSDDIRICSQR